ncbi:hypothetical protein D1BOALGB6SA_9259 [Olavius sp. associated proteobacterium Delta 1]|nr:hypothetical protein D1BOALGB6SA_9259 [Olavius sp. associated proteobacterium Delta 1]
MHLARQTGPTLKVSGWLILSPFPPTTTPLGSDHFNPVIKTKKAVKDKSPTAFRFIKI